MSPADKPDRSDAPNRRDRPADAAGRASAGSLLREARLAAGLDAVRLASDLRISAQALEALETGQYHLLPGDPYVRALLSSLARQLHLDPQAVIQTYLNEMGLAPVATGQVAPYQDKGEKHSSAHRKTFAVLLVVLLVGLVVVWKQLNRPQALPLEPMPGPTSATLVDSLTEDTLPESKSLRPDSGDLAVSPLVDTTARLSASAMAPVDTAAKANAVTPATPAAPSATPQPTLPPATLPATPPQPTSPAKDSVKVESKVESKAEVKAEKQDSTAAQQALAKDPKPQKIGSGGHLAVLQALGDSLWVKVMRDGKPDDIRLLHRGKSLHVAHADTVRIALSRRGALEMTLDGKVLQPTRKRFKIMGQYYRPY